MKHLWVKRGPIKSRAWLPASPLCTCATWQAEEECSLHTDPVNFSAATGFAVVAAPSLFPGGQRLLRDSQEQAK